MNSKQEKIKPFKAVSFPCGGGGNHLVHLMSLSTAFDCVFQEFGIEPSVKNKLDWIKKNIYHNNRTWYNWLETEWKYRKNYSRVIRTIHEFYDWEDRTEINLPRNNIPAGSQILFLEFDAPETILNHYMHINLGLNNKTPDCFVQDHLDWQSEMFFIKSRHFESCKFINGNILHQPVLDKNFYDQCCEWFGLEKFYNEASEIHSAWMQCRYQSARDFYNYFTGTEFNQFLEKMKQFGDNQ